jgi:pimeloyl-ACP methyl ester carboxylesterase
VVDLNYVEHGPPSAAPLVMLHGGAWRWQEYLSLILEWPLRNYRNARIADIDGVGHLLHLESPGQAPVLSAMLAFLDRI